MQCNVAGGRGQSPVIVPASVALTGFVAFVTRRLRQFLRFCLQQLVQRFFYAPPYQFLDLPLDTFSFSVTIFSDMVLRLLSNVCVATLFYQLPEYHVCSFLRNLLYLIIMRLWHVRMKPQGKIAGRMFGAPALVDRAGRGMAEYRCGRRGKVRVRASVGVGDSFSPPVRKCLWRGVSREISWNGMIRAALCCMKNRRRRPKSLSTPVDFAPSEHFSKLLGLSTMPLGKEKATKYSGAAFHLLYALPCASGASLDSAIQSRTMRSISAAVSR